jgi:hypothetical protein
VPPFPPHRASTGRGYHPEALIAEAEKAALDSREKGDRGENTSSDKAFGLRNDAWKKLGKICTLAR